MNVEHLTTPLVPLPSLTPSSMTNSLLPSVLSWRWTHSLANPSSTLLPFGGHRTYVLFTFGLCRWMTG